ncbi:MAG: hypothetical protein JRH20_02550 [Deltaproteobacteria bacterium]|nr:hypothetical protein [Deltaproteobacteria bacterium]
MQECDDDLQADELALLLERVFVPAKDERRLGILIDLPDRELVDHLRWKGRRELALSWRDALRGTGRFEVELYAYGNVHVNNADLPSHALCVEHELPDAISATFDTPLEEVFATTPLLLALTELSATAPLKLEAPRFHFRAATMPGFDKRMIPALRLDYGEVNRRVQLLKGHLDGAERAEIDFALGAETLSLTLDLRHRRAHASGGVLAQKGMAGNLPSGETYIVPYEGEREGDASRSAGWLPVELEGEVVRYHIVENHAVEVAPGGEMATREAQRLRDEPAYGNLAELGLGVLDDFGLAPIGEILLDEKLGLHIAFGRSDHFGGQVGAKDFSSPGAVVHIDRVYVPAMQPAIIVERVDLYPLEGGAPLALMRDGRYVLAFD